MGASSDPPVTEPTVWRHPSSDDLENLRHTSARTPAPPKYVSPVEDVCTFYSAFVDFANGDSVHGDFVRYLVSGAIDGAGRRWCCCYRTGRLGVTPDERTEAAKAWVDAEHCVTPVTLVTIVTSILIDEAPS